MNTIGTSTKLLCVFVSMYAYPILSFFFRYLYGFIISLNKRLAFVPYIADIIMTMLILLAGISNLINKIIRGYSIFYWNIFFLILSVVSFLINIRSWHKSKNVSNISMNIATVLSLIVIIS